jgi:two-component system cell cycle sensor histidine kinase/response regulator CckA
MSMPFLNRAKRPKEREELLEVRKSLLERLRIPFMSFGVLAALLGGTQAFLQGRWFFSIIYTSMFAAVLATIIWRRRLSFVTQGMVMVWALFIIGFAVVYRIGLSGIGLELLIAAAVLASVYVGIRFGLLVSLVGLLSLVYVALGMIYGWVPITEEHMLTSKSPLAWATSAVVFSMVCVGLVVIPQMFMKRLMTSLDLNEERRKNLESANKRLVEEISAREDAEQALRGSEDLLRATFESTEDGVLVVTEDGRISHYNSKFIEVWSIPKERIENAIDGDLVQYVQPQLAQPEQFADDIDRIYKTSDQVVSLLNLKDGRILERFSTPLIQSGVDKGRVWFFRDITDRKRAEDALRESEAKYRMLVHHAPAGILELDPGSRLFTGVNEVMCEYTGYTEEEFLKLTPYDLLTVEDLERLNAQVGQILCGDPDLDASEYLIQRKNGDSFSALVRSRFSMGADSKHRLILVVHDLTEMKKAAEERRKLESQLQQAQRLEAIGTMAGGIAHDFNNLLMGIQGRSSLMLNDPSLSRSHQEHLRGIDKCVAAASALTRQLLGFARGGKYETATTDPNELVKNVADMFGRTRKEISIHYGFQEDIQSVDVDRGQIEQVLLNIYVNAWQAISGVGDIFCTTRNVMINDSKGEEYGLTPGHYVKISISDTGEGMSPDIVSKIFDPFFTTKELGRGTGLGLASSYGIIKNHGGNITVDSEKGQGSTFHIFLPGTDKTVSKPDKKEAALLRGTETILLVDDEQLIVDVCKEMLNELGYDVFVAHDGSEAIRIYKEHWKLIDMVILDMIMPGMTGPQVFGILKELNPAVRVLISSGYGLETKAEKIHEQGYAGFVQKPFNFQELSRKIRAALEMSKTEPS